MSTIYTKVSDDTLFSSSVTYYYNASSPKVFNPANTGLYERLTANTTDSFALSTATAFDSTMTYSMTSSGTTTFTLSDIESKSFTYIKTVITSVSNETFYTASSYSFTNSAYINRKVFTNGINGTDGLLLDSSNAVRNFYVVLFTGSKDIHEITSSRIIAISKAFTSSILTFSYDDAFTNKITMNSISYEKTYSLVSTAPLFTSLTGATIAASGTGVAANGFAIVEITGGDTGSKTVDAISGDTTNTVTVPNFNAATVTTYISGLFSSAQNIYEGNNFSLSSTTISISVN